MLTIQLPLSDPEDQVSTAEVSRKEETVGIPDFIPGDGHSGKYKQDITEDESAGSSP